VARFFMSAARRFRTARRRAIPGERRRAAQPGRSRQAGPAPGPAPVRRGLTATPHVT